MVEPFRVMGPMALLLRKVPPLGVVWEAPGPMVPACGHTDRKTWLNRATERHNYHKIDS